MRAMLPKDILERFFDGLFHCEELRNRVSAYVAENLAGQGASGGAQPMDIGQVDKSKVTTKMSMQYNSVVHLVGPTRNTSRSPTTSENPSTVGLPSRHHQHHASRLHETRNRGAMRRNRVQARKSVSFAASVVERGHPARLCPSADDCQDVDEVGTEPSFDADSDLFGLGFKGAKGSHIKHYGQRRFRVKTNAGSNMITTWKVADVGKPLISASRLLERGHKLVLDEKLRIQCKNGHHSV